ncbi:hypothetical protein F5984_19810 [Rudanella paleaurantiibacter]|uniref:Uncharacterized protein n=1 Tax=Rudanella paleaurantiibacter TaxID=2614655 RepID=A0A7J5TVP6_9BACT|nr:hypothetical protein [Rudanella paleaurantiibacter]KAB7728003.1 hypothetical protein F5984_19810 [Rudanella paleaurantiibacter]
MKSFFRISAALALVLMGALVAMATGNELAGIATIPAVSYGLQYVTGYSLFSAEGGLAFGALSPIKRPKQGVANPGGGRRLFLIGVDQITADWPLESQVVDGEITAPPTLAAAQVGPPAVPAGAFVEVDVSDNSLKLDQSMKGSVGYQSWEQSIEVKIAGYTKEQVAAVEKLLNQEVVAVVIQADGTRVVVGTVAIGQQFEVMHTTGAKGSDRREWTLKSKQDGYMHGYLPLAANVIIAGIPGGAA